MNKLLEGIFKNSKPNFDKLQAYGFEKSAESYKYSAAIMDGQFALNVTIDDNDIDTEIIDLNTDEPYTLFLADNAVGSFVGAVRTAYEKVMQSIADKCFDKTVFKADYTQQLTKYVFDKYGDSLEFLWEKFSDNAVWRRKDNQKWYGILLTVPKNKLGLPSNERVEILDIRTNPDTIDDIVDNATVFRGYHMNKKHWITVCLDGSVPLDTIEKMLDISYELARKS